ncbi:MAG: prolyl oligopeptidase family serine peptidase, partial [Gammaproteobacteria bacterium]
MQTFRSAVHARAQLGALALLGCGLCTAHLASAADAVSLVDSVTMQEVDHVLMRPDGAAVAYVTHSGDLASNKNPHTLKVVSTQGGAEKSLLTADNLTDVIWAGDGHTLYGLAERDGKYIVVKADSNGGESADVWTSDEKIDNLAVAADGTVVYTTAVVADAETARRRKDEGMVFEWTRDSVLDIINRNYTIGDWEDFHLVDPKTHTAKQLLRLKYDGAGRQVEFVSEMKFSPDGRWLALSVVRRGSPAKGGPAFNYDVAVLDVQKAEWIELQPGSIVTERNVSWAADSQSLIFFQDSGVKRYNVVTRRLDPLPWAVVPEPKIFASDLIYDSVRNTAYGRTRKATYTFDLKRKTIKSVPQDAGQVAQASFDKSFASYAFVDEASARRPEVAVYDPKAKATRRVTNLNPWIDQRSLGAVEKLQVENASGVKVDAYLVYPVGYTAGTRYPFIIGTYGFNGKYILNAEWHTTFPAQALAGQGYAVLLLNRPPSGQSTANDVQKAQDLEGWQMMSTFERAAELMVSRGIGDADRMGLYGWSHGAFISQFLQAHSKLKFKAVAMGEGGDYNPSEYGAFGMTSWPQIFQNLYGGPFSARTAKAYTDFAPVLSVENFRSPMLMEFSGRDGFFGLEVYVPMRTLKVPAELVTYDDEPHNFVTPRARLASMGRKVDWFDYWMLGKQDPAAAKKAQYTRWDQMRAEWEAARPKQ